MCRLIKKDHVNSKYINDKIMNVFLNFEKDKFLPLSLSNFLTDALATFHAAWPLKAVGIEYFKFPSSISTWEIVIANSIFSTVISDFLW